MGLYNIHLSQTTAIEGGVYSFLLEDIFSKLKPGCYCHAFDPRTCFLFRHIPTSLSCILSRHIWSLSKCFPHKNCAAGSILPCAFCYLNDLKLFRFAFFPIDFTSVAAISFIFSTAFILLATHRYFVGAEINLISPLALSYMELLLRYGADPNSKDRTGLTPLMKACRHPQGKWVEASC